MALVEEVTDYTGWCVCSLDYRQVQWLSFS
jgi:hypothetical protein